MFASKGSKTGNIGNDGFDVKILSEKLSKITSSQQSIKSLSNWCISNQNKARQIVETWEKSFNSSRQGKHVSFLYLANEILQNSRRNGSEFVNEFSKVLPVAVQQVYDNGDENGKKVAIRLVDIWKDKKYFGSHVLNLIDKHVKNVASYEKATEPVKTVKKDVESLGIKLDVGGFCEKIMSAFHSLYDECSNEESLLSKCSEASLSLEIVVKEIITTISQGFYPGNGIAVKMEEHENVLKQCVSQLEGVEATRESFVTLLNEVVKDQESRLETLRRELKITRSLMNQVGTLKSNLSSLDQNVSVPPISTSTESPTTWELQNPNFPAKSPQNSQSQQKVNVGNRQIRPVSHITTSFSKPKPAYNEESKKAAKIAAKLAASTSSAQTLVSVFSSFVAQEIASKNDSSGKCPKLEQPLFSGADPTYTNQGSSPYFTPFHHPISTNQVSQSSIQASLGPPPPPPNPFPQSSSIMSNLMPSYGFRGTIPPPSPLFSHVGMGLVGLPSPQPLKPPQESGPHQNPSGGFYFPPGVGFYGSESHPSPCPIDRK